MISLDSLRPEFIDKTAERLKIVDKAVLERAIHAFVLLDRLAGTRAEFTFKGGTSLLLQLKEPRRLSVDIDTFCVMPADEFRSILEKEVCRNPPFFKMEDDLRGAYDQPQRRHYKLYYKTAYNKMRPDAYVLLDVVEEDAKIDKITRPIKPFFTLDDGELPSHVTMPSKSALLADKLTAFAPHTIGVRFDRGPDKDTAEHQVFKQLFDVASIVLEYAIEALLHALLLVAPASAVPPCVVVVVEDIEHEHEALVATEFLGIALHDIVALYLLAEYDALAEHVSPCLDKTAIHDLPVVSHSCPVRQVVGAEVIEVDGVSILSRHQQVVVGHRGTVGCETDLDGVCLEVVLLCPVDILVAMVVRHHLLYMIRWRLH